MKRFILATIFLFCFSACAQARQELSFGGWLVYWDKGRGLESLRRSNQVISRVSLFSFALDDNGLVVATASLPALPAYVKADMTVVNDVFSSTGSRRLKDARLVHRLLTDGSLREAHFSSIVSFLSKAAFSGIEIDYENLEYADRQAFVTYIKELAGICHSMGKTLTVAVQPKTTEKIGARGGAALDWEGLGRYADTVRIMCYNYMGPKTGPGPLSPPPWVAALAIYAIGKIPPEKLELALPLYGFSWVGYAAQTVDFAAVRRAKRRYGCSVTRDADGSPSIGYSEKGIWTEVWFEDRVSILEKIKAARRAGVSRFFFWRLGDEDDSLYPALAQLNAKGE